MDTTEEALVQIDAALARADQALAGSKTIIITMIVGVIAAPLALWSFLYFFPEWR